MALVWLKLSGFISYSIQPDQACQRFKVLNFTRAVNIDR